MRKYGIGELLQDYYSEIFEHMDVYDPKAETFLPLRERPSGIWTELERQMLLEEDLNDESKWSPLLESVGYLDFYMTEYLLQHGANPHHWCERETELLDWGDVEENNNFYLEHIDIDLIDCKSFSDEKIMRHILDLARIIMECEGVKSFSGICLVANKETGEVSIAPPRYKY